MAPALFFASDMPVILPSHSVLRSMTPSVADHTWSAHFTLHRSRKRAGRYRPSSDWFTECECRGWKEAGFSHAAPLIAACDSPTVHRLRNFSTHIARATAWCQRWITMGTTKLVGGLNAARPSRRSIQVGSWKDRSRR